MDLAHDKFLQFKCSSPEDPEASILQNVDTGDWEEWEFGCQKDGDPDCIDMADVYDVNAISDRVDAVPMTENPLLARNPKQV